MSSESATAASFAGLPPPGSVVVVRAFGWIMLATLVVFLLDNWLIAWMKWPGVAPIFAGQGSGLAWLQLGGYVAGVVVAIGFVLNTPQRGLRLESETFSNVNAFVIRAAFWGVLFVGVADAAISFLRVENLLPAVVGEHLGTELGRSHFRGPAVHLPLLALGIVVAAFTRTIGFHWLALLIVIAELTIVITRFVFSYEQAFMGDLVRFWYAALFLFASAYTLIEEGHVRVDVFYTTFAPRRKGLVNAIGSILLGMSVCWVILLVGMGGRSSIINGPLINFEVTQQGFGMYVKYLMAGFLGLFAISMLIQFVAYLLESVADWRGEPGARSHEAGAGH
ncbi:MAG: TRAP transporter small permease subunit [Burkholderiales bacterium]|nr:MAG: TRAP transporter small permease subunit [Burkholderiales bacterium]